MSKKLRSSKSKRRHSAMAKLQQNSVSSSSTVITTNKHQLPESSISNAQSQNAHYQYLGHELRQIGILAGAIVLVLVVLSFILG